jgi:hypothetical protein
LKCNKFERFGSGVDVDDGGVRDALIKDEGMDGGWVTDHLGIKADFEVIERTEPSAKI